MDARVRAQLDAHERGRDELLIAEDGIDSCVRCFVYWTPSCAFRSESSERRKPAARRVTPETAIEKPHGKTHVPNRDAHEDCYARERRRVQDPDRHVAHESGRQ